MNYRMIKYILGWLLIFEAIFFLVPMITALVYWESAGLAFLASALICAAVGTLCIIKKPENTTLYSKDGFAAVSLSWIVLSLFGTLPLMISGVTKNFFDALFETVSGFTTTGASIFSDVEALPYCVNIWRCFTHWVGGMGVLVFIMAFIPLGGAQNMNLMKAESPGPSVSKLVPRVKSTAIILYTIYIALTVLQFIILLFCKMSVYDALCTAFGTAGTGGFGIKNSGFAGESNAVQLVVATFMVIFAINFNTYYLAFKFKFKDMFSSEVRVFLLIVISSVGILTFDLMRQSIHFDSIGDAARHSFFNVASIISTTGYMSHDFNQWTELCRVILVMLMFIGGCAGSTAGGIKVSRIMILFKSIKKEVSQTIHPRQVKRLTLDKKPIEDDVMRSANAYIACYLIIFTLSILALSFNEHDLITNFTAVTATFNNVGPGLELVGPTCNYGFLSNFSKFVLTFDMLAGRLELFPMLILFAPATWKKR